jgi:hypothetical protein
MLYYASALERNHGISPNDILNEARKVLPKLLSQYQPHRDGSDGPDWKEFIDLVAREGGDSLIELAIVNGLVDFPRAHLERSQTPQSKLNDLLYKAIRLRPEIIREKEIGTRAFKSVGININGRTI